MRKPDKPFRYRKFVPIDRDYPIFELLWDDVVVLDVSATDDKVIDVAIHAGASDLVLPLSALLEYLDEGRKLVEHELG